MIGTGSEDVGSADFSLDLDFDFLTELFSRDSDFWRASFSGDSMDFPVADDDDDDDDEDDLDDDEDE